MKTLVWIGAIGGGIAGGYIPVLFGAPTLSLASVIGNTLGGVVGIIVCHRIARVYGL